MKYDVIIVGSGLFGTMLASILAKHGFSVVVLDKARHPRFAVGESTIPLATTMFRAIGEKFGVPEIGQLTELGRHLTSGVKRNFSFVSHKKGRPVNPEEITLSILPEPELQYYRQDVDSFSLRTAQKYGAIIVEGVTITSIRFSSDAVFLETAENENFEAKFLVDGSGAGGVLSRFIDLGDDSQKLRHRGVSVFTHMEGVVPFDEIFRHNMPSKLHEGTLHHIFDGGWIWIIPFNNHPESTNSLVSVGLSLEAQSTLSGAELFAEVTSRYPSLVEQLKDARAVLPWMGSAKRFLPYKVKTVVWDRFALLSHGAGRIDALFSKGMANSAFIVSLLAEKLIEAFHGNQFSREHFLPVELLQEEIILHNDCLVVGGYTAFKDFELWKRWFKIWWLDAYLSATQTEKESTVPKGEQYAAYFSRVMKIIEKCRSGECTSQEAANALDDIFRENHDLMKIFDQNAEGDGKCVHPVSI